ncbi:MAG TPA: hypothetical protein VFL57_00320 [Bryobacteraceae bacterium]|nr:hypothetical protein [Bryobacteraceae bacterium]
MRHGTSVLRLLVCTAAAAGTAASQSTHYSYTVQTIAGTWRSGDGGPATSALMEPYAVAAGPGGTLYIGELRGRIRRVAADATITTLADAGSGVIDLVADPAGGVLAATAIEILRVSPTGQITRVAGGGTSTAEGVRATQALVLPSAIAVGQDGRIYFAEYLTDRVRMIGSDGIVRTIAGTGETASNGDGGPATSAAVDSPSGVAVDTAGNVYIAEYARIRKVSAGTISTIAGTGRPGTGGNGGPAVNAPVVPGSVAVDAAGNVYFTESVFDFVRKITATGTMMFIAGGGDTGFGGDGGSAQTARLDTPMDVTVDSEGNLFIADFGNGRVRRINTGLGITTYAGTAHFQGDGGAASSAVLRAPGHAAYDNAGNLYIADYMNRRIRRVTAGGTIDTFAGNGDYGPKPDGVAATASAVGGVNVLAFDVESNLMFGGLGSVRRVDRAGIIGTFAGSSVDFGSSGDGGTASAARFRTVKGLAWDKDGNLYIADSSSHRIRKVAVNGMVSTFAGSGRADQSGDGGQAIAAGIAEPTSLAFDRAGNLYVLSGGTQVRRINSQGVISTILEKGVGVPLDPTARPANTVTITVIDSIAVDSSDTLYFSIPGGVGAWNEGKVWRVAGGAATGFGGDGGLALGAQFGRILGLSAGPGRTLVVADQDNHRVRVLTAHEPRQIEITEGNNQTAAAGSRLAVPLAVRVVGAGAIPAPLVPVSFAVISGSATLNSSTVLTDASGRASATLTLGEAAGPVKVRASVAGLTPVEFSATATAAGGGGTGVPRIAEAGITGAALSVPPVRSISANGIVTVWGDNFLAAGTERRLTAADLVDGRIPTNLGGVCVQFGSAMAPVFAVFPNQINVQVPTVAAGSTVEVRVIRNCGTPEEVRSAPAIVTAAAAAPEFFTFGSRPAGRVPVAARHADTNMIVGPEGAYGEASAPARPGSVVTVYATGLGLTSPAFAPGELPTSAASPVGRVEVALGGNVLAPEDVLYSGVTPGSAGLYQVNIRVPATVTDGEQPIAIRVGAVLSPAGPYLLIRR